MSVLERLKTILNLENVSRRELAERTGIKESRWITVIAERGRITGDEIEALVVVWPEYAYWLATGLELPEAGQISPLTKKAHELSKTAPGAG
tara:strand:- start:2040 stop:2315 length:276 start_codon:yes stop_codon:yes gene_type:complete